MIICHTIDIRTADHPTPVFQPTRFQIRVTFFVIVKFRVALIVESVISPFNSPVKHFLSVVTVCCGKETVSSFQIGTGASDIQSPSGSVGIIHFCLVADNTGELDELEVISIGQDSGIVVIRIIGIAKGRKGFS